MTIKFLLFGDDSLPKETNKNYFGQVQKYTLAILYSVFCLIRPVVSYKHFDTVFPGSNPL